MARTVIAVLVAGPLLVLASSAGAAVKCAPPGVSGVSQYYETLPGLSCNLPSPRPAKKTASHKHGHSGAGAQTPAGTGGGGSPAGTGTGGGAGGAPTTSSGSSPTGQTDGGS